MSKLVITDLSFCNSEFPGQSDISGGSVSTNTATSTSVRTKVQVANYDGKPYVKADHSEGVGSAYAVAYSPYGYTNTFAYADTFAS